MSEYSIDSLLKTAMNSIKEMMGVNTIIGDPIETSNNIILIPISKVSVGFAAGGSDFNSEAIEEYSKDSTNEQVKYSLPFGGGSGAGINVSPVGFAVINSDSVKIIPIEHSSSIDKLIDYVPDVFQKISSFFEKDKEKSNNDE